MAGTVLRWETLPDIPEGRGGYSGPLHVASVWPAGYSGDGWNWSFNGNLLPFGHPWTETTMAPTFDAATDAVRTAWNKWCKSVGLMAEGARSGRKRPWPT